MTKARQTRAYLAVFLAVGLAAAANGCEIIANFDRSLIPAEGGLSEDASYDAPGYEDVAIPETSTGDTGSPHLDAGSPDSSQPPPDANVQDTSTPTDTGAHDVNTTDTGSTPDTGADTGTDAGTSEDANDDGG